MRKFEPIDLMKLYTLGSHKGWNDFLNECYAKNDINRLAKVKYQISVGMDDLAKQKLNTEEINIQFVRWVRSLEITAKRIIKKMHPMPTDNVNSLQLQTMELSGEKDKALRAKRARDAALQDFMRKSSY